MKSKIKCPWCGKIVEWSKAGNLKPHLSPGQTRCVGSGQPKHQVLQMGIVTKRQEND
jgi:hypothetical protein